MKKALLVVSVWALLVQSLQAQTKVKSGTGSGESKAAKEQRMKWWKDARFGMFIHWGLYAVPAGEWKGM